jgi:hypothetical protein
MSRDGQVEAYRAHAATCVQLARENTDSEIKIALLDMARAWLNLADQAEKNSQTTLVYETPAVRHQVAQQPQQGKKE